MWGVRVVDGLDRIDTDSVTARARPHHRCRADETAGQSNGHDMKFPTAGECFPPCPQPGMRQEQPLQARAIHKLVPLSGDLVEAGEIVDDLKLEIGRSGLFYYL